MATEAPSWRMPETTTWAAECNANPAALLYGEHLDWIVRRYSYEAALEIGCAWGISTMAILTAQDRGALTSVDIDPGVHAGDEVRANGLEDRWTFVLADSREFWGRNEDTFDLIYVDGDHSAEAARIDLFQAWRALRPGGVIIVDDVVHPAHLDSSRGPEGYLYGVAFAAWQLVFKQQIREVGTKGRLLYIPKAST